MYWYFLKEADGFKETDKAVSQHLQNRIRRLHVLSRLGHQIFGWIQRRKILW